MYEYSSSYDFRSDALQKILKEALKNQKTNKKNRLAVGENPRLQVGFYVSFIPPATHVLELELKRFHKLHKFYQQCKPKCFPDTVAVSDLRETYAEQ